jgi:hypothetical protein
LITSLLVSLVAAWSIELVHIGHHWLLFRVHMGEQAARKGSRSLHQTLFKPQGILFLLSFLAIAWTLAIGWKCRGLAWLAGHSQLALLQVGMCAYAVLAMEFAYNIYTLTLGPLLTLVLLTSAWNSLRQS